MHAPLYFFLFTGYQYTGCHIHPNYIYSLALPWIIQSVLLGYFVCCLYVVDIIWGSLRKPGEPCRAPFFSSALAWRPL